MDIENLIYYDLKDWIKLMYDKKVIFSSFEEFLNKIKFMIKDEITFYHCFYKGKKTVTLTNLVTKEYNIIEIKNNTPETFFINEILLY